MIETKHSAGGTHVLLYAPYHPEMPAKARAIGGKWQPSNKNWAFDIRDEQRVRDLACEIYGTDGTPTQTVTVHLAVQYYGQTLYFAGREIAHRPSRDSSVRLGHGVIVIAGGFDSRGGSVKNPRLDTKDGTILEIRDIPAGHADLQDDGVTVISQDVDTDTLTAEREQLLARIAEIDALLPAPEGAQVGTEQAAQALGVSVRTVQRWAAQGKVEAAKDEVGHWVITITI